MADIETLRNEVEAAHAAADRATPGGLHGDPATVSGVQRRGGERAMARRFAAYDHEASATLALAKAEAAESRRQRAAERFAADAAAPCDIDSLRPGDYVRDHLGWHRVVRVSARSITVETSWSWTDRRARGRIVETRPAQAVTS